jgi:hypothetical protein
MKNEGINIHIDTPECDKLLKVKDKSQTIGAFLEWAQEADLIQLDRSINDVLAEYFEIDLDKVDKEKRAILDGLRAANNAQ